MARWPLRVPAPFVTPRSQGAGSGRRGRSAGRGRSEGGCSSHAAGGARRLRPASRPGVGPPFPRFGDGVPLWHRAARCHWARRGDGGFGAERARRLAVGSVDRRLMADSRANRVWLLPCRNPNPRPRGTLSSQKRVRFVQGCHAIMRNGAALALRETAWRVRRANGHPKWVSVRWRDVSRSWAGCAAEWTGEWYPSFVLRLVTCHAAEIATFYQPRRDQASERPLRLPDRGVLPVRAGLRPGVRRLVRRIWRKFVGA
jgi:hypothetical protein